jgi:hypothetical protein
VRSRGATTRVSSGYTGGSGKGLAQVWVRLRSDDPEAVSALAVARTMDGGREAPVSVRRFRVLELRGTLPPRTELEGLLGRSIQFYNPQKELAVLRLGREEAVPLEAGERAVLVYERGGARRPAAERWWAAGSGRAVEVREGVVWALRFAPGVGAARATMRLAVVRDRRHGLFCNPHAEERRVAGAAVPFPWLTRTARARRGEP